MKSAYGLAEAPRLWYLRAAQLLEEAGMVEVPFARSTFVKSVKGKSEAVCTLHVDDGMLAGDPSSKVFQQVLKAVDSRFNIKEWKIVGETPVDFLGCKVSLVNGVLIDDMKLYVEKIQPMEVRKTGDELLDGKGLTAFRRLVMQMRWPAQYVLPEKLYSVSSLAQSVSGATMAHARLANKLLAEFKDLANRGQMALCYRPLSSGEPYLISFFDASLGKSHSNKAQQGQVHFVSTAKALSGPDVANIVEFRSSRITRVVKSSLAAEGNSLSTAADEQLYLRLLCEVIWYGLPKMTTQWKESLRIPGVVVTDAKALFDHLLKTGHLTAERQTMLDILAAKQLIESASMKVAWVPTFRQFADGLTKDMLDELFAQFKRTGTLSLVETPADQKLEEHRASLRRAQRERRKIRMKKASKPTTSFSNVVKS